MPFVSNLKEKIDEHPCVRTMREVAQKVVDYQTRLANTQLFNDQGSATLALMQEIEQTAETLKKTIEEWETHITDGFTFKYTTSNWRHHTEIAVINLDFYPQHLKYCDLRDPEDQAYVQMKEQSIRTDVEIVLADLHIIAAWLEKWTRPIPIGFRLTLSTETAPA